MTRKIDIIIGGTPYWPEYWVRENYSIVKSFQTLAEAKDFAEMLRDPS